MRGHTQQLCHGEIHRPFHRETVVAEIKRRCHSKIGMLFLPLKAHVVRNSKLGCSKVILHPYPWLRKEPVPFAWLGIILHLCLLWFGRNPPTELLKVEETCCSPNPTSTKSLASRKPREDRGSRKNIAPRKAPQVQQPNLIKPGAPHTGTHGHAHTRMFVDTWWSLDSVVQSRPWPQEISF